ncbi:unknown protein [Microcystis aeruginosa NIES-843]|uniref:Uncharacterized protein n=1 Tax=Microcystis aeruginosa (strain NIES-843 / IAM M-2473) TaxID=449447 RepID=B0JQ48_MICAN|nr:unknown protein [Microcystis aeruginosa NIES-843]
MKPTPRATTAPRPTRAEGSGVVAGGAASHLNPQLQSMCMVRSPKIDRWSSRSHIRERTLRLRC